MKRILGSVLLAVLFGGAVANAEGEWLVLEGESEGHPYFMMVDDTLKNFDRKAEYPWSLLVSISIKERQGHGLPTDAEAKVLNELEDRLLASLRAVTGIQFVGRETWNGFRDLMIFVEDPEKANPVLQDYVNQKPPIREFEYRMERDPEWKKAAPYFNYKRE